MSLKINISVLDSWGPAAKKISGNKITGIKVHKKKVLSLWKMRSILRRFRKGDFSSTHLRIEYSRGRF